MKAREIQGGQSIVELWQRSESLFSQNNYDGHDRRIFGAKRVEAASVMLTAPHAVNHFLNEGDDLKVADLYTGGLVRALGHGKNIAVAFNCARHPTINPHLGNTPLDDLIAVFARACRGGWVIDVHGCKNNDDFDLAIGTGGNVLPQQSPLITALQAAAGHHGLRVALNPENYQGLRGKSLVSRHREKSGGIAIVQLEIAKNLRDPSCGRQHAIVATLSDTIDRAPRHDFR